MARTAPRLTYPGLLLLAAATLLLEVGWTRVLSVALWYHFAFMVLSTALFGFGFAGVALSLRRDAAAVPARLLARAALLTPPAFVAGYGLFNLVPFEPFSLGSDGAQWLYLALSYLAVTLPFFFAGATIAALLTRHARAVHRLYLFDLVGAGLGSLAVVVVLPWLGGSGTILAAAALAAVGAALIGEEAGRRHAMVGAALAVLLAALSPFGDRLIPVRITENKVTGGGVPVAKVFADERFHKYTAWNTLSRVDVIEFRDPRMRVHRSILIDGGTAVTRIAHPLKPVSQLGPAADDESFFVQLLDSPHVLVVGSGGGREVLLALRSGAARVTAVEINASINEIVTDVMAGFTRRLYEDPRVAWHTDEARSFLRRSERRYDLIHCPHTISNSAMASGSLSLAENYLLTLEGFHDYLDHLSGDGVLLITRPEAHLPRLFVTARAALAAHGVNDASAHLLAWRRRLEGGLSFYAGFALRMRPFSFEEVKQFQARVERLGMEVLYLPGGAGRRYYGPLARDGRPGADPVPFAAILEPATDDRPFFNRRVPFSGIGWSDLSGVFDRGHDGRMALEDRPVAEAALVVLLLETSVLGLLLILAPLYLFRRRALAGEGRLKNLAAFAALGLAYIVVEVGLIQRFTLFLGRPVVVFSTVLGTLLVSSGLGSAVSRRFENTTAPRLAALAAGGTALLVALLAPPLVDATLAWPGPLRVLLAVVLLAPPGFVMGMPFPLLVRRLEQSYPERIPWAWGVNGFASVVGTIGAVLIGMTGGYTAVLLVGVGCYLAAAGAAGSARR